MAIVQREVVNNHIPLDLAMGVQSCLKGAIKSGLLTANSVNDALRVISETRGMGWDWKKHWAPHTFLCYAQNFEKAYKAASIWAQSAKPSHQIRVLDLGCGTGASTAGTCTALLDSGKFKNIIVHGVDRSPEMVDIFGQTFLEWLNWREPSNIRGTVEVADAGSYLYGNLDEWDLVVCCYVFCGDSNLRREFVRKKDMIVIDLPANEGYSRIEVGDRQYRLGYDNSKTLDVSFVSGLGLSAGTNDWYPVLKTI